MTIDQIEKVIKVCKSSKKGDLIPDLKDVLKMLENLVLEQTNLKSLNDVEKVLFFYKSYKNEDWFKQGIRKVLEQGTFPEIIKEIVVPNTEWPERKWPDPLVPNPWHPVLTSFSSASLQLNKDADLDNLIEKISKEI